MHLVLPRVALPRQCCRLTNCSLMAYTSWRALDGSESVSGSFAEKLCTIACEAMATSQGHLRIKLVRSEDFVKWAQYISNLQTAAI